MMATCVTQDAATSTSSAAFTPREGSLSEIFEGYPGTTRLFVSGRISSNCKQRFAQVLQDAGRSSYLHYISIYDEAEALTISLTHALHDHVRNGHTNSLYFKIVPEDQQADVFREITKLQPDTTEIGVRPVEAIHQLNAVVMCADREGLTFYPHAIKANYGTDSHLMLLNVGVNDVSIRPERGSKFNTSPAAAVLRFKSFCSGTLGKRDPVFTTLQPTLTLAPLALKVILLNPASSSVPAPGPKTGGASSGNEGKAALLLSSEPESSLAYYELKLEMEKIPPK